MHIALAVRRRAWRHSLPFTRITSGGANLKRILHIDDTVVVNGKRFRRAARTLHQVNGEPRDLRVFGVCREVRETPAVD
jgi:hypothetical protein